MARSIDKPSAASCDTSGRDGRRRLRRLRRALPGTEQRRRDRRVSATRALDAQSRSGAPQEPALTTRNALIGQPVATHRRAAGRVQPRESATRARPQRRSSDIYGFSLLAPDRREAAMDAQCAEPRDRRDAALRWRRRYPFDRARTRALEPAARIEHLRSGDITSSAAPAERRTGRHRLVRSEQPRSDMGGLAARAAAARRPAYLTFDETTQWVYARRAASVAAKAQSY